MYDRRNPGAIGMHDIANEAGLFQHPAHIVWLASMTMYSGTYVLGLSSLARYEELVLFFSACNPLRFGGYYVGGSTCQVNRIDLERRLNEFKPFVLILTFAEFC
jgi:hypothetical protein